MGVGFHHSFQYGKREIIDGRRFLNDRAKIKKSVLVEGRTGSMFIAKRIEMNLLHTINLELTKLKLLPIKTTLNIK